MAGKKTDTGKNTEDEQSKKPVKKQTSESISKSKTGKEKTPTPDKTPAFNSVIPPKENAKSKQQSQSHNGISRSTAVFLALLAAITGGAIGWLGPTMFKNTVVTDTLNQTVQTLQSDLKTETTKRANLESTLKSLKQSQTLQTEQLQNNINTQKQYLTDTIASNIDTELSKVKSGVSELTLRLDAQEVLGPNENDPGLGAQALLDRITTLETQITALQNQPQPKSVAPEFPLPNAEPVNLPERSSSDIVSQEDKTQTLQFLIDTFPRDEMLTAVRAQNKIAAKKPSWLQNVLSRHVKVKDDNTPAHMTITAAEKALIEGRVGDALSEIKKLNPPVRIVAKEWVTAATEAQKTLDTPTHNRDER